MDDSEELPSSDYLDELSQEIRDVWIEYEPVQVAMQAIGEKNLAVSRAFKILLEAGTIEHGKHAQLCPLCTYEHVDTLSGDRFETIESWNPTRDAERAAREKLVKAMNSLLDLIRKAIETYDELLPSPPSETDWEMALKDAGDDLQGVAAELRSVISTQTDLNLNVSSARTLVGAAVSHPTNVEQCGIIHNSMPFDHCWFFQCANGGTELQRRFLSRRSRGGCRSQYGCQLSPHGGHSGMYR